MSDMLFDGNLPNLNLFAGDDTTDDNTSDTDNDTTPDNEEEPHAVTPQWVMPKNLNEGRMYHKPDGVPYHQENSVRGIEYAAKHGYDSIDLDMNITKRDPNCPIDGNRCIGHIVNTHWLRPLMHDGFRDPLRKIPQWKSVSQMTLPEIVRLVAGDGYHIGTMASRFRVAARHGLIVSAEAKADGRFGQTRYMRRLMDDAISARCRVIVKSAYTAPLEAAKRVGFQTRYTRDHRPGM